MNSKLYARLIFLCDGTPALCIHKADTITCCSLDCAPSNVHDLSLTLVGAVCIHYICALYTWNEVVKVAVATQSRYIYGGKSFANRWHYSRQTDPREGISSANNRVFLLWLLSKNDFFFWYICLFSLTVKSLTYYKIENMPTYKFT